MMEQSSRHEKGHYWAIGYAIGFPLCFTTGLIFNKLAIGTAAGLLVGFTLGLILEKKFNKNPVVLNKEELRKRKKITFVLFLVGILVLALIALSNFLDK